MATTAPPVDPARSTRGDNKAAAPQQGPAPGELLAPPPKLRRRPALIAAAVAAICLGALASVWAYNSASNSHEVLAVRQTVERGTIIEREDVVAVRVSVDPALKPLAGDRLASVIGKRAALDIPAGGVVTAEQVTSTAIPAKGESVAGISLSPAMLPADQLRVGDPVRVVTTPGDQGEITAATPAAIDAVVVGLGTDKATGNTIVNVQVPYASAPKVAARAATGKVALVLDSRER